MAHEPGDGEGAWSLADGHIGDRVFQAVEEDPSRPGEHPLPADSRLDPIELFGFEGRIGLGDVIADPEGPVQLVQGRRPEAGIGRPAQVDRLAQLIAGAQTAGGRRAAAVGGAGVQQDRAAVQVALDPPSLAGLPAVHPQAAGEQQALAHPGGLAIDAAHLGAAASHAAAGEPGAQIAEMLPGLAVGDPKVGAHLPGPGAVHRPPGGVHAIAERRSGQLLGGRAAGRAIILNGGEAVLQVAGAQPGLQPPAAGVARRGLGQRQGGRAPTRLRSDPLDAAAAALLKGRRPAPRTGT